MIQQIRLFLGPARIQALFFLLAFTGLGNLLLNVVVDEVSWARDAQTVLVFVFLIGGAVIVIGRLSPMERGRWTAILSPALGAVILGAFIVPRWFLATLGLAAGWMVAGGFLFRQRGPMEYREAVRHLRKNRYAEAAKELDALIKQDSRNLDHHHFRAEIFRVWGKLDRARKDYLRMTELDSKSAAAYNGLAEVELQMEHYDRAHEAAIRALELAPDDWVAFYNLGIIEDRLGASEAVIEHLDRALAIKISDPRHRLLAYLFKARAYARLGDTDSALEAAQQLKKHRSGLNEWQILLQNDQASTLRAMLEDDIQTVQGLLTGELTVEALTDG